MQHPTQNELILDALTARRGDWVPMPELSEASGSWNVHSRIADLRAEGHDIDNKIVRRGRQSRSYYRIPAPEQQTLPL